MKAKKKILLFVFSMGALCLLSVPSGAKEVSDSINIKHNLSRLAPTTAERQYIGYGYDVTGGKPICDIDALMLNHPILDVDSDELLTMMKAFDASQTTYISDSSSSARAISSSYGIALSGGVRGTIPSINLSIGTSFNTNIGWSSSSTKTEEYSYHTIVSKNKTVVLQANMKELRDHLDYRFLEDAKAVRNTDDAKLLIKTYGSHLLTGYTLGGLFELTNYFATDSASYVREVTTSFDSQVSATISGMELGTDFSFAMNFGSKDNNSHAVNNYKCSTYGGLAFPGLTIDQAFKYYETAFGAGYIYQIWTDSINEGTSLVICDIPQSSRMVPLWEILPLGGDYDLAKTYLIDAYLALAADGIANHSAQYPDVVSSITLPEEEIPSFKLKGFEYFSGEDGVVTTKYVPVEDSKVPQVISDFVIALDYDEGPYKGINLEWSIVGEGSRATMLDSRSGIFKVGHPDLYNPDLNKFRVEAKVGEQKIYGKTFEIIDANFSAGNGTEKDPFIITTPAQLVGLSNNSDIWDKYFELGADLDMTGIGNELKFIGNSSLFFSGQFDGAYHTISNLRYDYDYLNNCAAVPNNVGLFGKVSGTIKRLNINNAKIFFDTVIDNASSTTPAKEVGCAGFIAAQMEPTGRMEECVVTNSDLHLNKGTLTFESSASPVLYVGGLVGLDKTGYIADCHVLNSSVFVEHDLYAEHVSVGGLVGYCSIPTSTTSASIKRSSAVKTSVYAYGKTNGSAVANISVGGLIGYAPSVDLEDVLVSNPESIIGIGSSAVSTNKVFVGSVIGKGENLDASNKFNLKRVVTSQTAGALNSLFNYSNNKTGSLMGYVFEKTRITANDVFVDSLSGINVFGADEESVSGVSAVVNLTWSNGLNSNITGSEYWRSRNGYPSVVYKQIDSALFEFDFSQAKTEFIVGETFKSGDITITGYDSDGNDFPVSNFSINHNAFDSEHVGTYQIIVSSFGASASYDVTVKEAKRCSIKAELIERTRYEDENVSAADFNVYSIDDLGHRTLIGEDEFTISSQKTLEKGDNLVTISTYDGKYSSSVVVHAKARKITGLNWTNEAPELQVVYGSNDIDLKGAAFTVEYDAGPDMNMVFATDDLLKVTYEYVPSKYNSYDMNANVVDVIVPSIKYGKGNTGLISYGDYNFHLEFDIEGLGAPEDEDIDRFIGLVESIEGCQTLVEKHAKIREAYHLLDTFGDFRNDDINSGVATLKAASDAYDLAVNAVNEEIEEGVIIASSFNYETLARAGVVSYSLVLAIILLML